MDSPSVGQGKGKSQVAVSFSWQGETESGHGSIPRVDAPDQAGCEGVKVCHSGEMEALVHGLLFSTVTVTKAQYIDDRMLFRGARSDCDPALTLPSLG